jgi:hypothetical protein
MPPPARTHLPLKPDPATLKPDEDPKSVPPGSGTIFDQNDPRENEVHPELQRLPALSLRGTFLKAYELLIRIVSAVGWDELLKYRSHVFVMEEEYRIHRALAEETEKMGILGDDEAEIDGEEEAVDGEMAEENDEAKLKVVHETESSEEVTFGKEASKDLDLLKDLQGGDSAESLEEEVKGKLKLDDSQFDSIALDGNSPTQEGRKSPTKINTTRSQAASTTSEKPASSPTKSKGLDIDELLKKTAGDKMGSVEGKRTMTRTPQPRPKSAAPKLAFRNKRLCEKWLDNLFMVLYNDLRLYTALKQEITQYKAAVGNNAGPMPNQMLYRKTGSEWEIYGDLALRLEHPDDAKAAYRLCLDQKFSVKSMLKLLEMSAGEGNIKDTLSYAVKLVTILDRAFVEHTYPGPIGRSMCTLIGKHGLAKVQNALISLNVPQRQYRLITRFFE